MTKFCYIIVDKLIRNLGDPRVAEKLRIYRLVEEQFDFLEAQVQKQVTSNICIMVVFIACVSAR